VTVQVLLPAVELMTAPAVQVVPAPETMAKSPGLALVGSMTAVASVRLAVPVLVRVTICDELFMLTIWLPNPRVVAGFSDTIGAVPDPVNGRSCGLVLALSAIFTVAVRALIADGVKVAAIVQVPSAGRVGLVRQSVPLAGVTSKKSAKFPVVLSIATLVMVSGPFPELVKTEVDCVLVVLKN
jgi:hypothetical protein